VQRKRFLVIVRAGDTSCHPGWTQSLPDRSWDLVVSYFGADPGRYRNDFDRRIDDQGQKWQGLHALMTRCEFWRDYEYVWLPDDDLAVDQAGVDRIFELMAGMDLDIAQPALDWNSYASHLLALRWPHFSVRFTNFVEIMAPCFRREFLETCLPTFRESRTGWGLDFVWPMFLGGGVRRSGVLDEVTVTHTRPVGGPTYDRLKESGVSAHEEARALLQRLGVPPGTRQTITAAIDRSGRFLHGGEPRDVEAINALARVDLAGINAYRGAVDPAVVGTPRPSPDLPGLPVAQLGAIVAASVPRR
jgi:hypothetical protein